MKIAFVIPSLINQGPIIVVKNIIDCLISNKEEVDISVYFFDKKESEMIFPCPIFQIKENKPIDFDAFDIIHSHCLRPDRYVSRYKKKGYIKTAKIITTFHQDTYQTFSYEYNKYIAILYSIYWIYYQTRFDTISFISKQLYDKYHRFFNRNQVVIYNGCLINRQGDTEGLILNSIANLKLKYRLLGAYAVITKRKGFDQILSFLKVNKDYAFVLIGDGSFSEDLKKMGIKNGITDRLLFIPYLQFPYLYLEDIDIYVMPSYSEGFGLSMVEAALQEKSIVCSDLPSFHEIFTQEEVSFFELNNIKSLSSAISVAYSNKEEKGLKAKKKAETEFLSKVMSYKYLDLYKRMIEKIN